MATTPKRNRTGRANMWEFLLAMSRNPTIIGLLRFLTISAVLCFLLVVGLQGRPISIAGWTIGAQPAASTSATTPMAQPTDGPLPAALAGTEAPVPTNVPTEVIATTSVMAMTATEVQASSTPAEISSADCPLTALSLPRNAQLTSCAWVFLDDARFVDAIAVAEECIDAFEGQALRDQQSLSLDGQPAPLTGQPGNKAELNEILKRGVLNDVAACHFVKGQALERLDRLDDARDEYQNVLQYPHARVWDPAGDPAGLGFFWSPAQAAADRLSVLP